MSKVIQRLGMNHIIDLKQDALDLWKECDMNSEMWIDCVNAVLQRHRLDMEEQESHGDHVEKEKDRRSEEEMRLESEAEEKLQSIKDAYIVFNADADD